MGNKSGACMVLVERPEGKRLFGKPRRRLEENIKTIFKKWERGMDWIDLAQDRDGWRVIVKEIMNLWVP
jgi:hypothetical protein